MHCLSTSIIAALAVILSCGGAQGQKIYGACTNYEDIHPGTFPENPMPGQYVPQCNQMDQFEVIQKHPSTGYKWCVHPMTGEKLEGSDVKPGPAQPECGKCFTALSKFYFGQSDFQGDGFFAPQCDSKGKFSNPQLGYSYSWCVDPETGIKIEGSEVVNTFTKPAVVAKCDGRPKRQLQKVYGPCSNYAETHPGSFPEKPLPGQYVPQCNNLDMFEIVQKHPSTGYKWCVNPMTGEKVEGSDVKPGFLGGLFSNPKCGKCFHDSAKYNINAAMWGIGGYPPECDAKGLYKAMQGGASKGLGPTWCVNPETGDAIKGSEVAAGAGEAKC